MKGEVLSDSETLFEVWTYFKEFWLRIEKFPGMKSIQNKLKVWLMVKVAIYNHKQAITNKLLTQNQDHRIVCWSSYPNFPRNFNEWMCDHIGLLHSTEIDTKWVPLFCAIWEFAQSWDCVTHSQNPEIAQAISRLCNACAQSWDCITRVRNLKIASACMPDGEWSTV